jgi:hypothetical protein
MEPQKSGPIEWEVAVSSAQLLARKPFHVGGSTAIDLLGLSHYLRLGSARTVWLYDSNRSIPSWLEKLDLDAHLVILRRRLFARDEIGLEFRPLDAAVRRVGPPVERPSEEGLWRQFLRMSAAERATLELLAEVDDETSFETADTIFEGVSNLRPEVLRRLLRTCTSIKAKRLFFFLSDRHQHGWARALDADGFDLGKGKRQVVKGGKLDHRYQITVPDRLASGNASDG